MAAITITKGKEWGVIAPVYQDLNNFSLWRNVRTNGTILRFTASGSYTA